MAWPCITRACCIARFWNQLDKGDIAVPLVFTKYSEVTDGVQHHTYLLQPQSCPSSIEGQPPSGDMDHGGHTGPSKDLSHQVSSKQQCGSTMRQDYKPWNIKPEPSCKPKDEYHPSETPFEQETQYKKDFKAWPIPRRGDHPWIHKPSPGLTAPTASSEAKRKKEPLSVPEKRISETVKAEAPEQGAAKVRANVTFRKEAEVEPRAKETPEKKVRERSPAGKPSDGIMRARDASDIFNRQIKEEGTGGSSYRNEFKAWTDAKPSKSIRTRSLYKPPEEKVSHETSYNSQFKGEANQPGDNKLSDRRRIRSLYSEPYKETVKVEKPSVQTSRPKKTPISHKPVKKAKEKQTVPGRVSKKKTAEASPTTKPEDKEKSNEINNKLAEAKE
ncbi:microtubule-associated protein 6 isoform X2 [Spea bombifrons]|nr:microtubule-associated protein 6 isoform X2 [Spea bombifrons]